MLNLYVIVAGAFICAISSDLIILGVTTSGIASRSVARKSSIIILIASFLFAIIQSAGKTEYIVSLAIGCIGLGI